MPRVSTLTWGFSLASLSGTAELRYPVAAHLLTLQIDEFFSEEFVSQVTFAGLLVTAVTLRKVLLNAE